MIGNGTARSRTARRSLGVAVAAAVAVLAGAGGAGAESNLKWKFAAGDSFRYRMDQKAVTQVKGPNQDIKTSADQVIDTTWSVVSVDASGNAVMTQTIDRVRTKIVSPFGTLEYDSKDGKVPEGPIAAGVVPTLKALVGAKFQYKMTPQGELSDIQVPDSLVKVFKEAGQTAGKVGALSEEGLKNMIKDSSLVLPADAEKGKPWTRQSSIPSPPVGTMRIDKTYTYTGADADGEKITLAETIALEPDPKSTFDIKIGKQEGGGSFIFDAKAGRISGSSVTQKIEMIIKLPNVEMNQTTDTTTTIKLLDPKADESK